MEEPDFSQWKITDIRDLISLVSPRFGRGPCIAFMVLSLSPSLSRKSSSLQVQVAFVRTVVFQGSFFHGSRRTKLLTVITSSATASYWISKSAPRASCAGAVSLLLLAITTVVFFFFFFFLSVS